MYYGFTDYVLTLGQNSREYGVPNEINDDDDDLTTKVKDIQNQLGYE